MDEQLASSAGPARSLSQEHLADHPSYSRRDMDPLIGIDTSRHNWPQGVPFGLLGRLNRMGVRFLIARASLGTIPDPAFAPSRHRAAGRGWQPGGYHFLYPGVDPAAQAEAYLRQLDASGGPRLLCELDVEYSRDVGRPRLRDVDLWVERFRKEYPAQPLGVYSSRGIWASYGNPDITDLGFDYAWNALWPRGVDTPADLPERPPVAFGGEGRAELWQWGSLEVKSPTSDRILKLDGNAFYGSLAQLQALARPERPPLEERPAYRMAYNDAVGAVLQALAGLQLPGGTPAQRRGQEAALEAATSAVSELVLTTGGAG